MAEDLYQVLGVSRSADQKTIRRAYREKARKYHPDINKGPSAEEQFKRISEANDVLSDPEARAQYDRFGEGFRQYAGAGAAQGAQRASSQRRSADQQRSAGWSDFSTVGQDGLRWDDLFGDAFAGRRGSRAAAASAELELSVEEAYRGGRRTIRVSDPMGGFWEHEIDLPAGAVDGEQIRISRGGGWGEGGSGDLLVTLRVADGRRYKLHGADIEMELPVSPWEAALGAEVETETPGGRVTVHVPAGSSSGRRLRLRGQGMRRSSGAAGDLYARLKIVLPPKLTDRERELFARLREESKFEPRTPS